LSDEYMDAIFTNRYKTRYDQLVIANLPHFYHGDKFPYSDCIKIEIPRIGIRDYFHDNHMQNIPKNDYYKSFIEESRIGENGVLYLYIIVTNPATKRHVEWGWIGIWNIEALIDKHPSNLTYVEKRVISEVGKLYGKKHALDLMELYMTKKRFLIYKSRCFLSPTNNSVPTETQLLKIRTHLYYDFFQGRFKYSDFENQEPFLGHV